ncbi:MULTISPECIES: hypothetical protein [unclassified Bradyrhizobium]|uniref:hypothetical protein n=1 Tax=Bradyrhizobium sp. USDA 4541 TaxID=2817704 RepID=UPI0020A26EF0|nr:hypothetical protein [Bradyrhizobium sp. USDA 4541]MCP1852767.1 hypothetical protein [Bradyrhizobium sp. USDA 4541]
MFKLLEGANGTLAFLLLFACFMFGVYIIREITLNGVKRVRLQAAISLCVAFAPEAASRMWIWYWRHLENGGADVDSMLHSPVLLITALVQIVGVACVIRVFAPDRWGREVWIFTTLVAAAIAVTLSLIA